MKFNLPPPRVHASPPGAAWTSLVYSVLAAHLGNPVVEPWGLVQTMLGNLEPTLHRRE